MKIFYLDLKTNTSLFFFILIFVGCTVQIPAHFNANSSKFKNKYQKFIKAGETEIASWYHYVKTRRADGKYVLRTFFPETKQITSEVIYLDKALTRADGLASYWHENGNLKSTGHYKNGKSEGEWKFYHRKSGNLSSEGSCILNQKVRTWKNYDSEGRLKSEYNYQNDVRDGKFIVYDSIQNIINSGIYKADTIYQQTLVVNPDNKLSNVKEQMPHLSSCKSILDDKKRNRCSNQALLEYIYRNLKYPAEAREYGLEGMTVSQFSINKDGKIEDLEVVIGLCQEFKDECERVLSKMPPWEAGTQKGKKVKVQYTMPIKFRLEG